MSSFSPAEPPLLDVQDLQVEFRTREGVAKAVNGASYTLRPGETLAVLGESGSGKSVTAQAIMGILDSPPGFVTGGKVLFKGDDLLELVDEDRRALRGESIAMVFQDALSSLNPVFPVGWQIAELFRIHRGMGRKQAQQEAIEALERVNIPAARERIGDYPHQFSGGMRQRVMIAMAIALHPDLLIADEPTTALDVTVQAQILELMADLQREENMGLILITHDLGVVAEVADNVAVMYAGLIVEQASISEMFASPSHPYTVGLMDSIPSMEAEGGELKAIKGLPPSLVALPPGCAFAPRCPLAFDKCRSEVPPAVDVGPGRMSRCHLALEVRDGRR